MNSTLLILKSLQILLVIIVWLKISDFEISFRDQVYIRYNRIVKLRVSNTREISDNPNGAQIIIKVTVE